MLWDAPEASALPLLSLHVCSWYLSREMRKRMEPFSPQGERGPNGYNRVR